MLESCTERIQSGYSWMAKLRSICICRCRGALRFHHFTVALRARYCHSHDRWFHWWWLHRAFLAFMLSSVGMPPAFTFRANASSRATFFCVENKVSLFRNRDRPSPLSAIRLGCRRNVGTASPSHGAPREARFAAGMPLPLRFVFFFNLLGFARVFSSPISRAQYSQAGRAIGQIVELVLCLRSKYLHAGGIRVRAFFVPTCLALVVGGRNQK